MLEQFPTPLLWILLAAALALGIVLLFLYFSQRRKIKSLQARTQSHNQDRIDFELTLADQVGRMKLIRELHQVTVVQAHQVIQKATSAKTTVNDSDEYAARVFQQIASEMEDARSNMRRILSLVTDGTHIAQGQPRLKSVKDLFDSFRDSGLTLNLEETGERFELKPGAEIAIYRLIQEALENVLKHGGQGTEVWATLNWEGSGLQINIDDDGVRNRLRQARGSGIGVEDAEAHANVDIEKDKNALVQVIAGPGISQMRQRVELFDGFLNAYEVPGVGFSIQANFKHIRLHP